MERPQGLFLVFLFFVGIVTGSPAHGRIQIRGGHYSPPEDVVSFETDCKCNRDEEMTVSVDSNRLPGLKGISGGSDIMFDYSVTNCDGKITYSPVTTTFKFKIDEECGVYLAENAPKVPTYRAHKFEGYIMQAQLDFYYIDNTGTQPRSQFLTADVNCVCPHELDEDEKDSCTIDEGGNLRFQRTETIKCQSADSAETVCKDFAIPDSDHGCYTVEKINDTHIDVKFDFDVADDKCLAQTGSRSDGQAGSIETVSTSVDHNSFMEINLYLTLEKSLTVNGVDLVDTNDNKFTLPFDMQYKDSWSQTFTCAKLPHWSDFSRASECQVPCGEGKTYSRRICRNGVAGAPGCEGSSVQVEQCAADRPTCDEPCPTHTTSNGDFCTCDEETNRIWVLLPVSLIRSNIDLKDKDIFNQGFQNHVVADLIIAGDQINFYYQPEDVYLMEFSPRVTNLETFKASLLSWNPIIHIKSSDFGSGHETTMALHRIVDFSTAVGADKTFTGMTISKLYSNTLEYKIQAILKWISSTGEENKIERVLEKGRDWCLATPNIENFPKTNQPPKVDVDEIIDDECPEPAEPLDCENKPVCEIRAGENVAFTDYDCDGCRIRRTVCKVGGSPDGVVTYHFPSGEDYEEILKDWLNRNFAKANFCKAYIEDDDRCPVCTEDQLPQWSEWSACSSICGNGKKTRTRNFNDVKDCDPGSAAKLKEEDCLGWKSDERELVDADEFEKLVTNPNLVEEHILRNCSNAFCHDHETVLKVIEFEDQCYETKEERSCKYCCEIYAPAKGDFDAAPCVTDDDCKTGFKTITKKSECEDVDHHKVFREQCSDLDVDTFCQCSSDDIDNSDCVEVETTGKCELNNESGQWVRLEYSCKTLIGDTVCDGTESCTPAKCVPGEKKVNCCEDFEKHFVGMGDQCVETTRKCYDKDGKEVFGETSCPGCKTNICNATNILDCTADQLVRCRNEMGGELFCNGLLPFCESEQELVCKFENDMKPVEKCKYKKKCECDAYKCTENSFAIEGVNQGFLNKLKYRTNDLHETYGPDLNFFIGGGSKTTHLTEGCFHHYRSKSSEATDGINLVYSFDDLENKCGIDISDDNKLNVTVWVDDARHTSTKIASATPFAHVICHVIHEVNQPPEKNVTSLMRFKPFEFIKIRKFEHDLSFDISTDPGFNELLEHRELQNLVLVGDRMYARIRSNGENDEDLKIKVVQCTVKKVNNQDLSLNFIQDGCHSKDVEEFDFKFGQKGYENGAGNEIRFEWTNFVWRGFTNIEGDESTTGREEQQYSCDVEICARNQECTPSCAKRTISAGKRKRRNVPEFEAFEAKEDEGVDFELEVFRTEAELKKRYQEILAEHVDNSDKVDLLLSKAMVTLAACVTIAVGLVGLGAGYRQFKSEKINGGLTARIFRRFPPMDPPKYSINPTLKIDPISPTETVDYASTEVADFVTTRSNKSV